MPPQEQITRVWIEEGCIVCDACETAAPTVFHVTDDTCVIRPEAMDPSFTKPISQDIVDAAEECPVDVIKFDSVTEEVAESATGGSDSEAAPEAAPAPASEPAAAPVAAAKAKVPQKPEAAPAGAPPVAKAPPVAAHASMAGEGDPAIQALLRAAKARGGNAGLLRRAGSVPESVEAMRRQDPSGLPPDARMAKVVEAAQKTKSDPDGQRRAVVGGTALMIGWGTFAIGTGVAAGPAFLRFMMPNVLEEPDPRVRVGKLQRYLEMVPGGVNEDYKPQGIWMIREDERIAALNIICTHLGCIPNWLPNDRKFKCPCHGSGYRPDGINFEGPTPRPLERFRVFVEDGLVIVDKSKKYQYELGQWDQPGSFVAV